jgi:hypothetical protein
MNIQFSTQPWNKKVDSFNYFDLADSDPRKSQLSQYFIGKERPDPVILKADKVIKRKGRDVS